jgi:hypothetical protein
MSRRVARCATVPLTGFVAGYWSDGHGVLSIIRRSLPGSASFMHESRALRDKMPVREISPRSGLSRNTPGKYLQTDIVEPRLQTPSQSGRCTWIWCSLVLTDHMSALQLLYGPKRLLGCMRRKQPSTGHSGSIRHSVYEAQPVQI